MHVTLSEQHDRVEQQDATTRVALRTLRILPHAYFFVEHMYLRIKEMLSVQSTLIYELAPTREARQELAHTIAKMIVEGGGGNEGDNNGVSRPDNDDEGTRPWGDRKPPEAATTIPATLFSVGALTRLITGLLSGEEEGLLIAREARLLTQHPDERHCLQQEERAYHEEREECHVSEDRMSTLPPDERDRRPRGPVPCGGGTGGDGGHGGRSGGGCGDSTARRRSQRAFAGRLGGRWHDPRLLRAE